MGVVGQDQHNAQVLADLLDALEQDLKKFLIGDKLEEDFGEGERLRTWSNKVRVRE